MAPGLPLGRGGGLNPGLEPAWASLPRIRPRRPPQYDTPAGFRASLPACRPWEWPFGCEKWPMPEAWFAAVSHIRGATAIESRGASSLFRPEQEQEMETVGTQTSELVPRDSPDSQASHTFKSRSFATRWLWGLDRLSLTSHFVFA